MEHEAVELLSRYIRIDTTVPPGNERQAVDFFADLFTREGIPHKRYESAPERASIRAVLTGSGSGGALILLSHIDVVPAERSAWGFDPFGGDVRDGWVHGRGALDMKGHAIMALLAFLALKRNGAKLRRDVIFLAAADEEALGFLGVKHLLETYPEDFQADIVLNEGGLGVGDLLPDRPLFMIATAEKGPCWLHLARTGPAGHGSMPHGNNALEKMVHALDRLLHREMPPVVTPVVADGFRELAAGLDALAPYRTDESDATLLRALQESGLFALPQISAMFRNTISLNALHAGIKTNVIPGRVEAELDVRLLPGTKIEDIMSHIKDGLGDDDIAINLLLGNEANESPRTTAFYALMEDVLHEHFPSAMVIPSLLVGTSDSRFFRERGIVSYGVTPIVIPLGETSRIHGVDERISVANLLKGTEVMTEIVRRFCTA